MVSRVTLPVGPFPVFFKPGFLIFNWLNDFFSEREDGSSHSTSSCDNAKEESLCEMFHRIDSHHV